MSLNQAKAFNVKNEIVLTIEKYDVGSTKFTSEIQSVFNDSGYHNSGKCESDWVGYGIDGKETGTQEAAFCIKEITTTSGLSGKYYKVKTFYQLDLPLMGKFAPFTADGETKTLYGR